MTYYDTIGLMSGTSLDGLDIAGCRFHFSEGQWDFKMLTSETAHYPANLKEQLQNCMEVSALELTKLNLTLGEWIGQRVHAFIQKNNLNPLLIASHGHTVFHQPEHHLTLQIGDGHSIHKICKVPVICNFRHLDVLCNGQGAPLVPIGDKLLFDKHTYCLNLGGISNISFNDANGNRIAFDICPVNMVLNELIAPLGKDYDENGAMAKSGQLIPKILDSLNALSYYKTPPPKSLGKEWVWQEVLPLLDINKYAVKDLLHTFCHHIAIQVNETIKKTDVHRSEKNSVLVTGGGAFNIFLLDLFNGYSDIHTNFIVPSDDIVEYKEALVFAFIGLLRYLNKPNILKSVTGASTDVCSGDLINNLNINEDEATFKGI